MGVQGVFFARVEGVYGPGGKFGWICTKNACACWVGGILGVNGQHGWPLVPESRCGDMRWSGVDWSPGNISMTLRFIFLVVVVGYFDRGD